MTSTDKALPYLPTEKPLYATKRGEDYLIHVGDKEVTLSAELFEALFYQGAPKEEYRLEFDGELEKAMRPFSGD